MEYPESISPQTLFRLLENKNWLRVHKSRLRSIVGQLKSLSKNWNSNKSTILEKHFLPILNSQEKEILRNRLRVWWRLAWHKHLWAFQSMLLMEDETKSDLDTWSNEIEISKKGTGPHGDDVIKSMTPEEHERWKNATLIRNALHSKKIGLVSVYVSERFFSFESLAKSLCSASCIQFLYKVIAPNSIIQHDEVLKVLLRLGKDKSKIAICKVCRFQTDCQTQSEFDLFACAYVALIHARMIKDYREECIFDPSVSDYFMGDFFDLSQDLIFMIEEFDDISLGSFLWRPFSFSEIIRLLMKEIIDKKGNRLSINGGASNREP